MYSWYNEGNKRDDAVLIHPSSLTHRKELASWTLSPILPQSPSNVVASAVAKSLLLPSIGHVISAASMAFVVSVKHAVQHVNGNAALMIRRFENGTGHVSIRQSVRRGGRNICMPMSALIDIESGIENGTKNDGKTRNIFPLRSADFQARNIKSLAVRTLYATMPRNTGKRYENPIIRDEKRVSGHLPTHLPRLTGNEQSLILVVVAPFADARPDYGIPSLLTIGYLSVIETAPVLCLPISFRFVTEVMGVTTENARKTQIVGYWKDLGNGAQKQFSSELTHTLSHSRSEA